MPPMISIRQPSSGSGHSKSWSGERWGLLAVLSVPTKDAPDGLAVDGDAFLLHRTGYCGRSTRIAFVGGGGRLFHRCGCNKLPSARMVAKSFDPNSG